LKHPDATLATYVNPNATLAIHVSRQIKHLKHTSEAFVKKHLKTMIKHTQHPDKTLATYM
jgi:hypothetical protein